MTRQAKQLHETAALEARLAEMERELTAAVKRIAQLEHRHQSAHEQILNDLVAGRLRLRELTFDDPSGLGRVAEGVTRDGEAWVFLRRDLYGQALDRRPLARSPDENAAAAARAAVERERHVAQKVLGRAETDVRHSIGSVREVLPLVAAIDTLRGLVARDPWPDGERRLERAQTLKAAATEVLAAFDRRVAEADAARKAAR